MMKLIALLLVISISGWAQEKVIYGDDDRLDLYDIRDQVSLYRMAQSSVAIVDNRFIDTHSDEDFIFNYSYRTADSIPTTIHKQDRYRCKEIIARTLDFGNGADFALIRLDRKVPNQTPLVVRDSGQVDGQAKLTLIGNSYGLPTKVAQNGLILANHQTTFFTTTVDSYAGNSGSAVLNQSSGVVEGILVRGENDFVDNGGCQASNVCVEDGECKGEDVVRATQFAHLIPPSDGYWEVGKYIALIWMDFLLTLKIMTTLG